MTVAGWCGPLRAATPPPCAGSSTRWAPSGVRRSPTSQPTPRTGSPTWSPSATRSLSAAPIRFMWWPAPPRLSMPSASGPGTTRWRWPSARPNVVAGAPPITPRLVPAMSWPASSMAPRYALCYNPYLPHRTPLPPSCSCIAKTYHPLVSRLSAQRGPAACVSRSRARKASPWTGGSPGRGAAASRYSSSWQAASCYTASHRRRPRPRPLSKD